MSGLVLPKSVKDSQRYIAWVFLVLLAYGVVRWPGADWVGRIGLVIGLAVVVTGWQSFGVIAEQAYNDLLLVTDLALLASYWLLLYYAAALGDGVYMSDVSVFHTSGTIFLLYAIWDVAALAGRDTRALATAAHLRVFAVVTFFIALLFFGLAVWASGTQDIGGPPAMIRRFVAAILWSVVLVWWQVSRVVAAIRDEKVDR